MEIVLRHSVAAPVGATYDSASRFARFVQRARQKGAHVRRFPPDPQVGRGLRWEIRADVGGKPRDITIELVERVPQERLRFRFEAESVEGQFAVIFRPCGPEMTEVEVTISTVAKSMMGRLLLQSARLVQRRIEERLAEQLRRAARQAEADWRSNAVAQPGE